MMTMTQDASTRPATAFALAGALSFAFTAHSLSDSEKYSTAMAPMGRKNILGQKDGSLT